MMIQFVMQSAGANVALRRIAPKSGYQVERDTLFPVAIFVSVDETETKAILAQVRHAYLGKNNAVVYI